jgi:hypothetical protein
MPQKLSKRPNGKKMNVMGTGWRHVWRHPIGSPHMILTLSEDPATKREKSK